MIVRYWMTKSPVTVNEDLNLLEAFELMRDRGIRRLPVVRHDNLVGLITLFDLYRFIDPALAQKGTLPVEAVALLKSYSVGQVMIQSPVTCDVNDHLEDVGEIMRSKKIGALPVLQGGRLAGIITESDVLQALTRLTRWGDEGKRICFRLPVDKKVEIFYEIVDLSKMHGLELLTVITHPIQEEASHLVLIRVRGEKVEAFIDCLWKSGYQVLRVD
ncbi:MAG: CBS domain-containing protein [Planctomycetes bacterium]|nr:CBS domain-containing protein [Planctomycetota bacterium]